MESNSTLIIRTVSENDAAGIVEIYNYYVLTSHATFELETIDDKEMTRRVGDVVNDGYPFLVAEVDGRIAGYAYAHRFRPRLAYRHSAEVSVYVGPDLKGRKLATKLYERLIPGCFTAGAHTLIAVISLPNDASVRLHEKFGFRKIGQLSEVGRKFERWIDVGYWQLLSENDRS
jgi:L-amino acid N-acyltransferase YncA